MKIDNSGVTQQLIEQAAASKQTQAKIQTSVAKKQLDSQKQIGEAVVDLIQQVKPSRGRGVDIKA